MLESIKIWGNWDHRRKGIFIIFCTLLKGWTSLQPLAKVFFILGAIMPAPL